jgi:hypothetical protein
MPSLPLQFLLLTVAGWITRDQRLVTEYLLAENAVLRQQLGGHRIRCTDAQRRKLATAAKKLGRKALSKLDTLCDTGHAVALVPPARCSEVRRHRPARAETASNCRRRRARASHGA